MALTDKQMRFVNEYMKDMNATQAYLRAGYKCSEEAARRAASRLLTNDDIQSEIEKRRKKLQNKYDISTERVLKEYARIAFFDPRKLFNADGSPKQITELDEDTAAVIAGLDVFEEYAGHGDDRELVGYTKKYKLVDKKGTLDSLSRHLGLFNDKMEVTVNKKLEDFIS